jgi:hypothetical protein
MTPKHLFWFSIAASLILLISCSNGVEMKGNRNLLPSPKNLPDSTWENLSHKRIYFGHQSVGSNIIEGINAITKNNPQIHVKIRRLSDVIDYSAGFFAHSDLGVNTNPVSKIDAFSNLMNTGIGDKIDIAFFKFCFLDISATTNISTVFNHYKGTMEELENRYPKVLFVHFTVPLTIKPSGLDALKIRAKNAVKILLRKPVYTYKDNIKRSEYNELLRKEYQGKEPLFDIARLEATAPNGSTSSFSANDKIYLLLTSDYTVDGSHLNEVGSKIIAEQLLVFLGKNLSDN